MWDSGVWGRQESEFLGLCFLDFCGESLKGAYPPQTARSAAEITDTGVVPFAFSSLRVSRPFGGCVELYPI
jgi:hypothetical protein